MFLLLLGMFLQLSLSAQESSERDYIEVKGNHVVEVLPDSIVLSIRLDDNSSASKSDILKQEKKMISVLKELDIDTQQSLKIVDYSTSNTKRNNMLSVKMFSLVLDGYSQVNEVIAVLNGQGITNVTVKYTGIKNAKSVVLEAKKMALQDAMMQADALVSSIGLELGKAILIVDSNSYFNSPVVYARANSVAKDSNEELFSELSITEFQPVKVTANLTVRFLILD